MSDYLETEIVNAVLRGGTYTPTTVYVALFTDATSLSALEQGSLAEEVVDGGGYIRKLVTFTDPDVTVTPGITSNTAQIDFPEATANWGNIRFCAIMDSDDAVTPGGNILFYGQLTVDKNINANDTFRFNLGDLDIQVA